MDIRKILNQSFKTEFEKNIRSQPNTREKRIRSAFTTDQIISLEKEFKKSPYIGIVNRKEIANILKIPERAVKIWFQNRRMKEKKDGTNRDHHYDTTGLNGRVGNDQLNNNLYPHSMLPQTKPKTSLNEIIIDNFLKKNRKHVLNKSTENREIEKSKTEDVAVSPYFQNDTITSSTNEANRTAEFSIELLKNYKNHLHTNTMKKTVKNKSTPQPRPNQSRKRILNEIMERRETCRSSVSQATPSTMQHQQTLTQIPSGYVPLYPQQNYEQCLSTGNVLWKPVDPVGMATGIPMRDFALLPNPQVPYPFPKHVNLQRTKCSCNCHFNSEQNPVAFAQENQIPQPQYVIAIPFHKNPVQFSTPI